MQYPTMLYLGSLANYKVARNEEEYEKLTEQGYTTFDKVKAEPEPKKQPDLDEDALKMAYEEIERLEDENAKLKMELLELEQKLAVYETAKDTNSDGQVSYDEMTSAELQELLKQRGVEFKARDNKETLIQLAKDSE